MEQIEVLVPKEGAGQRIDRFLASECDLSRSVTQRLILEGNVRLNKTSATKSAVLAEGDLLEIVMPAPKETEVLPEEIPLDIYFEDESLLVVEKPKGMVVHPAPGHESGTLVNALLHHCKGSLSGIGGELRPGIVHRIDKDTSGILVVAKEDKTHAALSEQFSRHSITREYQAVVYGHFKETSGRVEAPVGRSKADRKKMAVTEHGSKQAITDYEVIAEYPGFSHMKLTLHTGRTHQIRVHMAYQGHPVAGDAVYGPKKVIAQLDGQCLHAGKLGFIHPKMGQPLLFQSPLPPYFRSFLEKLKKSEG